MNRMSEPDHVLHMFSGEGRQVSAERVLVEQGRHIDPEGESVVPQLEGGVAAAIEELDTGRRRGQSPVDHLSGELHDFFFKGPCSELFFSSSRTGSESTRTPVLDRIWSA